ncbi:MAG: TetR/AcrR family transcriptional regulator [Naasia sp.]
MDSRQRRTQEKLYSAILSLAEDRAIGEITASETAAKAGVNRSTFYEHAESPAHLLRAALRAEMQAIQDDIYDDVPEHTADNNLKATHAVLDHVERYASIYSRGLGRNDDTALHSMLSGVFRGTVEKMIEHGVIELPASLTQAPGPEAFARFLGDGTVGVVDAWLAGPAPRTHDRFIEIYGSVLPGWWPYTAD